MLYHCLVYFDPQIAFGPSAEAQEALARAQPFMETLKERGQFSAFHPLSMPDEAVTLQVRDGKLTTRDGPFVETKEMLGGILVIEARDMNEAIQIASGIPHIGIGHVEVRPAIDFNRPRPQF